VLDDIGEIAGVEDMPIIHGDGNVRGAVTEAA